MGGEVGGEGDVAGVNDEDDDDNGVGDGDDDVNGDDVAGVEDMSVGTLTW